MISCLIVDDEPLARQLIREFLQRHEAIQVVGEAGDGLAAVEAIRTLKPQLIFLDVEMPELSGFEVLENIDHNPMVVFCTAYDHFAVKAFDVAAVDYLVKPVTQPRFDAAMARVTERISRGQTPDLHGLLQVLQQDRKPLRRLMVKDGVKVLLLDIREIHSLDAVEDYVQLHCNRGKFLINQTLNELEQRLDPELFVRIHRSHLVNLSAVAELNPLENGRYSCRLANSRELPVSRAGVQRLKALML